MSLEEKLAAIREGAVKRVPAEQREIMANATKALKASGILDQTIKVGDRLPPFSLKNQNDETVNSGDLLASGPLVFTVFRGSW